MRKGGQRLEAGQQRAPFELSHELATDSTRPHPVVDDELPHLGNVPAERLQISAAHYTPLNDRDDEPRDTSRDFVTGSRK